MQILDHALGPLERLLAECASRVERHDSRQILQFLGLFGTHGCDVFGRLDTQLVRVLVVLQEEVIE